MRTKQPLRKNCPVSIKIRLLSQQRNTCYYCGLTFCEVYNLNNKIYFLEPCFDHIIPFGYLQTNPKDNWVAACALCNSIKHSKVFNTRREIINHVRKERKIKNLPCLPRIILDDKIEQSLLFSEMSIQGLGLKTSKNKSKSGIIKTHCVWCHDIINNSSSLTYCSEECKIASK
jgi:hypothetical protein